MSDTRTEPTFEPRNLPAETQPDVTLGTPPDAGSTPASTVHEAELGPLRAQLSAAQTALNAAKAELSAAHAQREALRAELSGAHARACVLEEQLAEAPLPDTAAAEQQPTDAAALAELQAKNVELTEQFLRAQAEMQNTRRRADEEMSKARKFAIESFAESLLPVADSLEAGLAIKDATPEQIREGAEATLRQLKAALERNKVIEINPPVGARFDPHQHQAISVVPAAAGSQQEPNTVVTVLQKGYSIAERVLRPAMVTVAAPQ